MTKSQPTIRQDWIAKTLAGIILGFGIALGCSGLFLLMASEMGSSASAQLVMWLLSPVWLTILSTVYLFRSGPSAWLWLASLNILVFALFFLIKSVS